MFRYVNKVMGYGFELDMNFLERGHKVGLLDYIDGI